STILQTTTPATTLRNAGRGSQVQRVRIDGSLDRAADAMQMQLQVGQQPPIAVKVEEGQAYGRQGSGGAWVELEQTPDLFAPGGDPLGFLVAVEDVRQLGADAAGMEDFSAPAELRSVVYGEEHISRYAFTLSGPKFARFMKEQMEAELRRKGELPGSMSLSTADQYMEMTGHGEMWIGAEGLPVRQLIHVEFPPQAGVDGPMLADISTAFSGWAALPDRAWTQLWHDPTLLTQPSAVTGISPQAAQATGMTLGVTLLILGLLALLLTHRRRWAVRAAVYGLIIVSMVITPLLQTQQVSAFYDNQQARVLESAPAPVEAAEDVPFNPHENPLRVAMADRADGAAAQASAPAAPAATTNSASEAQAVTTCTVTESSHCDEDGLSDQIEIHQLGTFADDVDTDNDGISDDAEIQPFTVGSQTWYLDPRSSDSNEDGLSDLFECSNRGNVNEDQTIDTSVVIAACGDTDGDGVPDVYDFDNDGDGVPDSADSAPDEFQPITDGKFGFALKGYEANRSLFVDLVIRPTDDRHLWWANNVLDWPANDVRGQVQRVT
ncbi:MAG: thrombospondin type 3 repeat-containing protein, partial [Caldilineaceae bacterium]|nr:thrombospondin type 3 repeat-containing protein [Caldilineaceae bacterium]